MKKIRTAILGYGRSGGSMHAGAIEHNRDSFEMAAVCDIDPKQREKAARRFGCPVYEDYHEMLKRESLDLVVVVTRTDQHCRMTCDCLGAGTDVLVTKPWAVNASEARQMIAAAADSGKLLLPWLPARWGCVVRRLKELVAEKAVGNVFLLRHTISSFGTRCDWQTERKCGGGYLLNWGPHIVDPPPLVLGSKVESVYGRMKQVINPGDTEDVFMAVMNLANGAVVLAEYTIAAEKLPTWFLQGDRGTIVVHGSRMKISRNTPARPEDPTKFATMQSADQSVAEEDAKGAVYGDENGIYAESASALRGEKKFPVTPADALELSMTLDAVRTSSTENRVVQIER